MAKITIESPITLTDEYTVTELSRITGWTTRTLQREIKLGRLKYCDIKSPIHGGHIVKGKDFLEWLLKYRFKGILKLG